MSTPHPDQAVTLTDEQAEEFFAAPPAPPAFELAELCSGSGQYHSDGGNNPKPLDTIRWHDIESMLIAPPSVAKESAQWAIFSTLKTRTHAAQRQEGTYYVAWADFDTDPLPLGDTIGTAAGALPCDLHSYTSRSATEAKQKSRLLIPLAEPCPGEDYVLLQEAINDRLAESGLEPDRVTERAGQLCYLPNRGEFYETEIIDWSGPLDWRNEFATELETLRNRAAEEDAHHQAAMEAAKTKRAQRQKILGTGQLSPVDEFEKEFCPREMWESYGAIWRGNRGLSPLSSSDSPALTISSDGRLWHSHHGSDLAAGIGTPDRNGGGCWGSSFDLFVHFEHGGDFNAAVIAAGDTLKTTAGVSINKYNQDAWRARESEQERAKVQEHFDDLAEHDEDGQKKPFSLARFSLAGKSHEMKVQMMDDSFVLDGLAIAGQITCFYAPPNAGKTLLTLRLLIDRIERGEVNGEHLFYINADDNYKGLVTKLELAEKHGFHMLAPGHGGFESAMFSEYLVQMTKDGSAANAIIVLDTLKKFTDLMDKQAGSRFMTHLREFNSHGGTVIMLAHTNKHRGDDGKLIHAGTSDVVDDIDCAFMIDAMEAGPMDTTKTVTFENFKSRGDVESEVAYRYSTEKGQHYHDLVGSVTKVSDEEAQRAQAKDQAAQAVEKNQEIIGVLLEAMGKDKISQPELVKAALDAGFSRRAANSAIKRHTGENWSMGHRWAMTTGERNAKFFERIGPFAGVPIEHDEWDEDIVF